MAKDVPILKQVYDRLYETHELLKASQTASYGLDSQQKLQEKLLLAGVEKVDFSEGGS